MLHLLFFFGGLVYLKIPQKINLILNKLISDIKNEIDESEKLRTEAKTLLDNAQKKLDKIVQQNDLKNTPLFTTWSL